MRTVLLVLNLVVVLSCGPEPSNINQSSEIVVTTPTEAISPSPDSHSVIVAFGDSLTAGYGVPFGQSYPDYLQHNLNQLGLEFVVYNEGLSGDTSSGGIQRKEVVSALNPKYVIVAFGGNDGLRGLDPEVMRFNLQSMINYFQQQGSQVILAGMKLPPNYGREYLDAFEKVFPEIAAETRVPLIPFLLEGVGNNPKLMQADGLHPTAEGNQRVAKNVLKVLAPILVAQAATKLAQ